MNQKEAVKLQQSIEDARRIMAMGDLLNVSPPEYRALTTNLLKVIDLQRETLADLRSKSIFRRFFAYFRKF